MKYTYLFPFNIEMVSQELGVPILHIPQMKVLKIDS